MQTIRITEKDAVAKSITIKGYINPDSSHLILRISGISLTDLVKLNEHGVVYKGFIASNSYCIDLNKYTFSILN